MKRPHFAAPWKIRRDKDPKKLVMLIEFIEGKVI